jgi:hypothetical protein
MCQNILAQELLPGMNQQLPGITACTPWRMGMRQGVFLLASITFI